MSKTPKPTLLAFHGSGSNNTIFRVQLARLSRLLPTLTLHCINAPFPGPAGPGVLPFFEGCGPYYHWAPLSERVSAEDGRKGLARGRMSAESERVIVEAAERVREEGGIVVGVVGFSQGTRVASGLLRGQEVRRRLREKRRRGGEELVLDGYAGEMEELMDLRFAVNLCGSYPPPLVPGSTLDLIEEGEGESAGLEERIQSPAVHMQGTLDEWAWSGRMMIEEVYEAKTSTVVQVETGHHLPVRPEETERLRDEIMRVWESVKDK